MKRQPNSLVTGAAAVLLLITACSGEEPRAEPGQSASSERADLQQLLSEPLADDDALIQVDIRPSRLGERSAVRSTDVGWQALNVPVIDALAHAFETRRVRIVVEGSLPEGAYDFTFAVPAGRDGIRRIAQRALEVAFDLEVHRAERPTQVYIFEPDPELTPVLDVGAAAAHHGGFRSGAGSLEGSGVTSTELAQALEWSLARPVLDETGLEGTFDVELTWEADNVESLKQTLREQLGLRARPERRDIEVLVVRSQRKAPGPE